MYPELPKSVEEKIGRAIRLEYWTLFWLSTIIVVMYLAAGSSQAMKTAWIEDCLSLIPPILFIISAKVERLRPTRRFPYGFHRIGSLSFFGAACALLAMGGFLLVEALIALAMREHPTIGTVSIFGHRIWLGWLMMPTLLYSVIAPVILGRMKRPLAKEISDKILYTDADMNAADWHTGVAGLLGVAGIAYGYWWADALAAAAISLSIIKDGISNCRVAVAELLDGAPRAVGSPDISDEVDRVASMIQKSEGVEVRVRETGRYMRAVVSPEDQGRLSREKAAAVLGDDHWRLIEISVSADAPAEALSSLQKMDGDSPAKPPKRAGGRRP